MAAPGPSLESLATIREDGSRKFVHPADVRGRFTTLRGLAMVLLMAIYIGLPWIPINGNPALFFDVANRKFHLFGITILTQDLWLAFFIITGAGFALFYITALVGRVWCGWACPQTVFLDIIRRIERWIEGDAPQRKRLEDSPWTAGKTIKRGLKQAFFLGFAMLLAHVFMSYFVSLPVLYKMVHQAPAANWGVFLFVFLMSAALWFDFAWFREQFCIVLCPYGRLQSALMDNDTINIGYDVSRGEPRGKKGTPGAGDCIECMRCVHVCPTGIDIRQGLQIECIACAACIDACDEVMEKIERPRGLIRYDSLNGFSGAKTRLLRPRMIVYSVLLLIGAGVMSYSLSTFRPATVSLLRMTGAPFFVDAGDIRNQFLLRILSKRTRPDTFRVEAVDPPDGLQISGVEDGVTVEPLGEQMRPLILTMPAAKFRGEFHVNIRIGSGDGKIVAEKSVPFLGPSAK
jgi:cytochrome c oxidase accessory protein FixG